MNYAEHIREIERTAQGNPPTRDLVVVDSWLRCLNDYRLDPTKQSEAYIVPETQLREHQQQSEELIHIARSGLDALYQQVGGQNYVLLLSDHQGVAVEFLGDPSFNNPLRKAGLFLGSEWSEERAGTSAVGTCIKTGEVLTIHQNDHFDGTHTNLSCTAAPIFNTTGELTAVLDISLLSSPIVKTSQNLALHLVEASARRIELANLMARSRYDWVLRFARSPDFLDVDPEAAISINGSGCVTGMTHNGAKLLAQAANLVWRKPETLIGQSLSSFFEINVEKLPELTRARPSVERLITTVCGRTFFVHAIEPQPRHAQAQHEGHDIPEPLRALSGQDSGMNRLLFRAGRLAKTNVGILIQGETGTGKEYLARAIHECSGRTGRFIAINCAAIPEHLIESELFGHLGGAFTGAASKGRRGLIEEADQGTLFLDEIGDMTLSLQSRLLRVLSEKRVQPVGSTTERSVDIRVLAATHRCLAEQVSGGRFRADLLYRINAATLALPALRDRTDFNWLVNTLLEDNHSSNAKARGQGAGRHSENDRMLRLSAAALTALRAHSWPGNIRELDNALAVASALTDSSVIELAHLPDSLTPQHLDDYADLEWSADPKRQLLQESLQACGWNISATAKALNLDRSTVHRQMKRFGLERHR